MMIAVAAALALSVAPGGPASAQKVTAPTLMADFVAAGGGAGSFSSVRAFDAMIGAQPLQSELAKLRGVFGEKPVDQFTPTLDFAVADAWKRAGQDDVHIPAPTGIDPHALAAELVHAGANNGNFSMGALLDDLFTPRVHAQVSADVDSKYGPGTEKNLESVGDRFFSDLAQST